MKVINNGATIDAVIKLSNEEVKIIYNALQFAFDNDTHHWGYSNLLSVFEKLKYE